jgi:hypothetical protein
MMRRSFVLFGAVVAVAVSGVVASACSSSTDEAAPSRPVIPVQPDSSTSVSDGGDVDGEAAVVDPGCLGPDSCFKCEPVKLDDYLNACTDGQCTPFDNAARLPLFKAGQALPPVP